LEQLNAIGHPIEKIDFILMGGTFTSRNPYYQEWFVKRCYDALNGKETSSLESAKKLNESAFSRCIGLTVETRPDWLRLRHVDQILNFGATRVELGVQTVYDDVLNLINRGHTVSDSILATRVAKDSGFKVCYHVMPGLPGSSEVEDIEMFHAVFEDSDFKPDMIKIYPALTIKGTRLHEMWKEKEYEPLTTKKASELIALVKDFVPEWVRIQRIQRDVPSGHIDAGVKKTNLRQYVQEEMLKRGMKCRCIRCREIGHKTLKGDVSMDMDEARISTVSYKASGSDEVFVSLVEEKNDSLLGYLRFRDIANSHRHELQGKPCMIIREVKVVGRELPIGTRKDHAAQHRGFGKELINEAEKICVEKYDKKLLLVLSGIGVKEYYRKIGFRDNGPYLSKTLI
jgi:elongator complex protein 3